MKLFIGGSWKEVSSAQAYIGGAWRRVTRKMVYASGAWRTAVVFVPPMTVSISPALVGGYANPLKPTYQSVTTETATATPSGGLGPYTYAWTMGNTPNFASTNFTATVPPDTEQSSTASVTVTDSLGKQAYASVEVFFSNYSQLGK